MIDAFKHNRDIYSTIAALAFNKTYEECSEHFFDANGNKTDEVNREGKERRSQAKSIVLGILYGRSTKTIGDQLFGGNKQMTDEQRTKEAQVIYDAVLNAFPNLRAFMIKAQSDARKYGYVETILGRRRHIPDMQLKPYEFKAAKGYINPDIDPLDPSTLNNKNEIPERIVKKLEEEFNNYKYYGQVVKATKRLQDEHIKVINNSRKITDASRKCVNSIIQGSAADLTKMAMLKVFSNKEWEQLGAKVLLPVHDEIIAEVPIRNAIRASEILGKMMSEAGNFLPFPISCDVEITYKWYGLSFPCSYEQPNINFGSLDTLSESEIKWIQYHLFECEYTLPVYKDKDGKKPIGDAALGVNGTWSKEVEDAMYDYIHKYKISPSDFVDNIHHRVNGDVIN
jgi:DNA polymerase I-like protein with 3'-5' exonuclease and polymerase domains